MKSDPQNRLWWRRPARRLEAEAIRDALLAVAGTLDPKMYGPGTLDGNSPRRSVYLTVKRSQLIPLLQMFDAPERDAVDRRAQRHNGADAIAGLAEFAVRAPGSREGRRPHSPEAADDNAKN